MTGLVLSVAGMPLPAHFGQVFVESLHQMEAVEHSVRRQRVP